MAKTDEKEYTERLHEEELKTFQKWWEADKTAKIPIQEEFEECYKMYNGSHWDLKDALGMPLRSDKQKQSRPNAVENFVFSMVEGLVAEFSEEVDIIDYPVESGDDDIATVMTNLKKYILYKNKIKLDRERYARNYFLYGTGIWHTVWDPRWQGGRGPNKWKGEIRVKSLHPQSVFPDARCREDIEEGQRIHKSHYVSVEYIKHKFGKEVEPDSTSSSVVIAEEEEYRTIDGEDEQVMLVETWYKGVPIIKTKKEDKRIEDEKQYGMHVVWWCGETSPTYLWHENYVYHDPSEDCTFPFIFRDRYPRENSVWGFGEAHFLKSPQISLNKTAELILEGHMHFAMGQTFYKPGAISPKQEKFLRQYGTLPNMYFAVNNIDEVKRIHGRGVDPSLAQETQRLQRTMEGIVGRHDISQGRTPGSVVAFRALDLLAARARIRLRSAENAFISAYEEMGNYMNHLITKFYTENRAYRILGDDVERIEYLLINEETGEEHSFTGIGEIPPGYYLETRRVPTIEYGMFKPDEIKRVLIYEPTTGMETIQPYTDEVAREIDMIDMLKENEDETIDTLAEYEIYSPELDTKCKVSTSQPSDRAFHMEMAKELLMSEMIDEETFWYVLTNGKFPPYEVIMQKRKKEMVSRASIEADMAKLQAEQQQAMPQQQMPQEGMPMEGMPPEGMPPEAAPQGGMELTPTLQQIFEKRPDLLEKFNQLPPDAQQRVAAQLQSGSQEMI